MKIIHKIKYNTKSSIRTNCSKKVLQTPWYYTHYVCVFVSTLLLFHEHRNACSMNIEMRVCFSFFKKLSNIDTYASKIQVGCVLVFPMNLTKGRFRNRFMSTRWPRSSTPWTCWRHWLWNRCTRFFMLNKKKMIRFKYYSLCSRVRLVIKS